MISRGSSGDPDRKGPLEVARPGASEYGNKVRMKAQEGFRDSPKNLERLKENPQDWECRDAWRRAGTTCTSRNARTLAASGLR